MRLQASPRMGRVWWALCAFGLGCGGGAVGVLPGDEGGSSSPLSTAHSLLTTQVPALTNVTDGPGVDYELGVRFKAGVAGALTGLRFFKASRERGQHVGRVWSASGQLLVSATFTSETASGWQQPSRCGWGRTRSASSRGSATRA